jgi:hypothetical protein
LFSRVSISCLIYISSKSKLIDNYHFTFYSNKYITFILTFCRFYTPYMYLLIKPAGSPMEALYYLFVFCAVFPALYFFRVTASGRLYHTPARRPIGYSHNPLQFFLHPFTSFVSQHIYYSGFYINFPPDKSGWNVFSFGFYPEIYYFCKIENKLY